MSRIERALLIATAKAVHEAIGYLWSKRESPPMSAVNHWRRTIRDALEALGEKI